MREAVQSYSIEPQAKGGYLVLARLAFKPTGVDVALVSYPNVDAALAYVREALMKLAPQSAKEGE